MQSIQALADRVRALEERVMYLLNELARYRAELAAHESRRVIDKD